MTEERQEKMSPKCPTCGFVMCQQFDEKRVDERRRYMTPNGKFICYHCESLAAQEKK